MLFRALFGVCVALGVLSPVGAEKLDVVCSHKGLTVHCDYRVREIIDLQIPQASTKKRSLPITHTHYPSSADRSVLLFLIDTSNPRRTTIVANQREMLAEIVARAKPHHRLGIAKFDKALEILAPIGADSGELKAAIDSLRAQGLTTELYRSTLDAIRITANTPASRHAVVLLSDGMAEDVAYDHHDVVQLAQQNGVMIYGIGYAASVAQSPALQRIRRLAEASGGPYVEAGATHRLNSDFVDRFYQFLDGGGAVSIDLSGHYGQQELTLMFNLADGTPFFEHTFSLLLPDPPQPVAPSSPKDKAASPLVSGSSGELIWVIAAFLFLLLLLVYLFFRLRYPPLARLEDLDNEGRAFVIRQRASRLGRDPACEIVLANGSVSSYHADLKRNRDDTFTLTDLGSSNGTLVNGESIRQIGLQHGDLIELGEVRLRFQRIEEVANG